METHNMIVADSMSVTRCEKNAIALIKQRIHASNSFKMGEDILEIILQYERKVLPISGERGTTSYPNNSTILAIKSRVYGNSFKMADEILAIIED